VGLGTGWDCVVMADVLEHLRDPEKVLRWARLWSAPDATLVVSVPNARHWTVISHLLNGNWPYADEGILDQDHLRFFTRRELQKSLWRAGWDVTEMQAGVWQGNGQTSNGARIDLGAVHQQFATQAEADELTHHQYLAVAQKANVDRYGLTSIIIPCWNQLEYTRMCLSSLRRTVRETVEVLVIDNGSDDGTAEYLRQLAQDWRAVKVTTNPRNLGWVGAGNQGLAQATGQTVLLLNNDTVLSTGWLERLLRCLWETEGVGIAGPLSNNVSGQQCIHVGYEYLEDMDGWAWDLAGQVMGQVMEYPRLVGFCMALRRECVDQIGPMDADFGIGLCDDDDWCLRAHAAGWKVAMALDSFVHHWGSVTFKAQVPNWDALLAKNCDALEAKWRGRSEVYDSWPSDIKARAEALNGGDHLPSNM
jgi:O-antigen biosynthesis protein